MLRWLALALVASGCNFSPNSVTTDGGLTVDAALSDSGVPQTTRCGGPGVVRGPFVPNLASIGMLPITPERVAVDSGRLIVSAVDGMQVGALVRGRIDLRASAVEVVVEEAGTGDGVATVLAARFDPNHFFQLLVRNGMLITTFVDVTPMTSAIPYDPVAHRVWRIRENGGMLIFEVSPDRVSWVQLRAVATPEWVDAITVSMYVTNEKKLDKDNRAIFAQFNESVPRASWCAATALRDDFGDGVIGRAWDKIESGEMCQVAETGGSAVFTHEAGAAGSCFAGYATRALYDLRANSVEIAVPNITLFRPNWWVFFTADTGSRSLTLQFADGNMCAAATGFATQCTPYTGAGYWRLSHSGTELSWQVSTDRATWTAIRTEVVSAELAAVRISFGARRSAAIDTQIKLQVTDYNSQ